MDDSCLDTLESATEASLNDRGGTHTVEVNVEDTTVILNPPEMPHTIEADVEDTGVTTNPSNDSGPLGRGCRVKRPSTRLEGYITNIVQKLSPPAGSLTPSHSSGTPYPITHYVNCDKFSLPQTISCSNYCRKGTTILP